MLRKLAHGRTRMHMVPMIHMMLTTHQIAEIPVKPCEAGKFVPARIEDMASDGHDSPRKGSWPKG